MDAFEDNIRVDGADHRPESTLLSELAGKHSASASVHEGGQELASCNKQFKNINHTVIETIDSCSAQYRELSSRLVACNVGRPPPPHDIEDEAAAAAAENLRSCQSQLSFWVANSLKEVQRFRENIVQQGVQAQRDALILKESVDALEQHTVAADRRWHAQLFWMYSLSRGPPHHEQVDVPPSDAGPEPSEPDLNSPQLHDLDYFVSTASPPRPPRPFPDITFDKPARPPSLSPPPLVQDLPPPEPFTVPRSPAQPHLIPCTDLADNSHADFGSIRARIETVVNRLRAQDAVPPSFMECHGADLRAATSSSASYDLRHATSNLRRSKDIFALAFQPDPSDFFVTQLCMVDAVDVERVVQVCLWTVGLRLARLHIDPTQRRAAAVWFCFCCQAVDGLDEAFWSRYRNLALAVAIAFDRAGAREHTLCAVKAVISDDNLLKAYHPVFLRESIEDEAIIVDQSAEYRDHELLLAAWPVPIPCTACRPDQRSPTYKQRVCYATGKTCAACVVQHNTGCPETVHGAGRRHKRPSDGPTGEELPAKRIKLE